jgi:hypothetical protein
VFFSTREDDNDDKKKEQKLLVYTTKKIIFSLLVRNGNFQDFQEKEFSLPTTIRIIDS